MLHRHSPNSTWLVSSKHNTTRHVRRVEPMHFSCVELVDTRHDELDSLDTLDTSSSTGSTRSKRRARQARLASLLCNLYEIIICKLFTNLLEYTFILFILLD